MTHEPIHLVANTHFKQVILAVALFAVASPQILATTWYVNAQNSTACPCQVPNPPTPGCGIVSNPDSCIGDGVGRASSGDTVSVAAGTYAGKDCGLALNKSNVTVQSVVAHGAIIQCLPGSTSGVVVLTGSYITFDGFTIRGYGGSSQFGIELYNPSGGGNNNITNCDVEDVNTGIVIYAGQQEVISGGTISHSGVGIYVSCTYTGPDTCAEIPSGIRIAGVDIHDITPFDGIFLDRGDHVVIESVHVHHSYSYNGILVGKATFTTIQYSEVDNIGGFGSHGMYLGGFDGTIRGNKVHHNQAYGIHLWAAPQGSSPSQRYIVERNDVYMNGKGMVLGGGNGGGLDPSEYPKNVEVRYNLIHDNRGVGFWYFASFLGAYDSGNSFHHNTVYKNASPQMKLEHADDSRILVKNNLIIGDIRPPSNVLDALVWVRGSNLSAHAVDGNIYYAPDSTDGSDTCAFLWNPADDHDNCNTSQCVSFKQLTQGGSSQLLGCRATYTPSVSTDAHSTWGSVNVVDPTTTLWQGSYAGIAAGLSPGTGSRHGDYHLLPGSLGIPLGTCPPGVWCGGVCCTDANGGTDIDGEVEPTCTLADCADPFPGNGVGADHYLDANGDGTADVFDCSPADGSVCDGDLVPSNLETSFSYCSGLGGGNYQGQYDPTVFPPYLGNPGANEVCDGKDDNGDGICLNGGETDNDHDGYFGGCVGDLRYDCNDSDPTIHPGALELCDGRDNDCDGLLDICDPVEASAQPIAFGSSTSVPLQITGSYANLTSLADGNTYEVITETGSRANNKAMTKVWTFPGAIAGTYYNLNCEGFRSTVMGDNDSFSFSYKKVGSGAVCDNSGTFTSTGLLVNKIADNDALQSSSIGSIASGGTTVCVKLNDSAGDSIATTITLDRLFLTAPLCPDLDGDGYPSTCTACNNPHCPALDCNDNDVLVNPDAPEGPYGNSTCSDNKDNNCNGLSDASEPACWPITLASGESNPGSGDIGTIPSGSYLNTKQPNEPAPMQNYEQLTEAVFGNTSRLLHSWTFTGVPVGSSYKLHFEGYRPDNPDGDNFQFYGATTQNGSYTLIGGLTVNSQTETPGGVDSSSFVPTGFSGTLYIQVRDTNSAGNKKSLDSIFIDYLAIRTVP